MSESKSVDRSEPGGLEHALATMLAGVTSAFPAGAVLTMGSVGYDAAALVHKLDGYVAEHQAVHDARVALDAKVAARNAHKAESRDFLAQLEAALRGLLGPASTELAKFGLKPKRAPRPRSSEQTLLQAEKARKTRERRGTKGSRQKQAVKATDPISVTVGPDGQVTSQPVASTPTPAQQPASSNSGGGAGSSR